MESLPTLNPLIPPHLSNARAVIYGLGSLYTSLIPSLIVAGIGDHIAVQNTRIDGGEEEDEVVKCVKVLVLNGCNDRETTGYSAMDFVLAVTDALNYSCWAQRRLDMKSATSGVQDDLKRGQSQQHNNTCTNYRTTGTMNDVELLGLDLDAGIADMKVSNGGAGGGQGFILQQPDHQSVSPDHQHQHQTAISPLPVQDVKKDEGENGHIEDNDIDRYIDLEEPDSAVLVEEEVGEPWDCLSMHYTNPSNLPIPPTPPHPSLRYMRASSSSLSLSTIQSATSSALVSNSPSPFLAAQSTSAANRSAYTPPTLNTGSPSSSSSSSPLLLSSSMAAHANPLIMQSETGLSYICSPHPPSAYITHLVYLSAGQIPVDEARIRDLGITCIKVEGDGTNMYRAEDISQALSQVFNK